MEPSSEADRWQRIEEIFLDALDLPAAEHFTYLAEACDDAAMRQEVERMLRADGREDVFLDHPVASLEDALSPLDSVEDLIIPTPVAKTLPLEDIMTPPVPPHNDPMLVAGNLLCDRFRVIEFLAAGGMGEVYRVEDLELGGCVAVKILRPDLIEDEASMERFRREVLLARRVTHASVCRSFDIFRHYFTDAELEENPLSPHSLTFLSMELLQGETLSQRLMRGGPMKPAEAFPIIRQIAAGLSAAHREGIVHRDLKSSNIFLVPGTRGRRRAVITDFGLARLGSYNEANRRQSVTRSGVTLGTPAYMSPEQIKGEKISPATDIYALGVLIFEMVTGRFPFEGDDSLATAIRRLHEEPTPPDKYVEDLPKHWQEAILRCLQLEPPKRFQSTTELAQFLAGDTTIQLPVWNQHKRRWPWPAVAGGGLVLLLALTLLWRWQDKSLSPSGSAPSVEVAVPVRPVVAVLGFQNLTGRQESAWLSTALAEMLTMELAASPTLRALPGEHVARMKLELELPETASFAEDTLRRIHRYSGADRIVLGSYFASSGALRLDLRLEDATSGENLLLITENGQEAELPALVASAGQRLRNRLGALSSVPYDALHNALPRHPEAARLYTEGLAKLRLFDGLGARRDFQEAILLAPDSARLYTALARALSTLGRDSEAALAARRAFELADQLPPHERLWIEAQLRQATGEWKAAADLYRTLRQTHPDDVEAGLQLARIQTISGHGQEALVILESLRSLPAPMGLDGRIALEEAIAADSLADYRHSHIAARRAAGLAEAQGARWLVARAGYHTAISLWRLGQLDEAEAAARGAASTLGDLGDLSGQADALNLLANIYENRGDLETSKGFYQTALANHRQLGNRAGESKVLNNLAYLMFRRQDENAAEALYNEALEVARSIDRKGAIARTLHNLAILRRHQGRASEAEELFEQTLILAREIGDRGIQSTSLNVLGVLRRQRGDLTGALPYFRHSLELARGIGDPRGLASGLNNLAIVQRQLGELEQARVLFEESRQLCLQLGDQRNLGRRLLNLANVYRRWGKLDEARTHLRQAAAIYQAIDDPETDIALATSRAEIHLSAGDYAMARQQLQQALGVRRLQGKELEANHLQLDLARIELAAGDVAQAEDLLASVLESLETPSGLFQAHILLARCQLSDERLDAAQQTLAAERLYRDKNQVFESNTSYDLAVAELALRQGRWNDAERMLNATLQQLEQTGHLAWSLETRLLLSDLQGARGELETSANTLHGVQRHAKEAGLGHLERLAMRRLEP